MRLDPKYFNSFLAVVAAIAVLVIVFFTINSQQDARLAFKERMMQQDSLQTVSWPRVAKPESLRIVDFDNQFVLLHFWSNWSDASTVEHQKLARFKEQYSSKLSIVSAIVGLQKREALSYIQKHDFPFSYVAGSQQFSSFQVPGLPANLLYKPGGALIYISLGTLKKPQLDSLKAVVGGDSE